MTEYDIAKIGMVIIARDHSTRCPGKALADVEGKPALVRMVDRCRKANYIHDVIIATTEDSPRIVEMCKENDISYFIGSEDDILDRTYQCAKAYKLDIIARSWGDCIVLDPFVLNELINDHLSFGYDYTYLVGYPKGINAGVLEFDVLEHAWKTIEDVQWRLWFQRWFCKNMKSRGYSHYEPLDSISWCVDYPVDLEFVRFVYRKMGRDDFKWQEVLELWGQWKESKRGSSGTHLFRSQNRGLSSAGLIG